MGEKHGCSRRSNDESAGHKLPMPSATGERPSRAWRISGGASESGDVMAYAKTLELYQINPNYTIINMQL